MEEIRNSYADSVGKIKREISLERRKHKCKKNNVKINVKEIGCSMWIGFH
jgi:hypothetical protein